MTRYVIDAPTLVHVVDHGVRIHPNHQLVAPSSIRSEAMLIMLGEVRRGERTPEEAMTAHAQMTELKIRVLGDRMSRRTAWNIAVEQDWDTLRDAEYLAVTKLQADALVTVDAEFEAVAREVVPVAPFEVLARA